jgi:hypothetical protein
MHHKPKYDKSGGYMIDRIKCSCGWKSPAFFDGLEYANDAFQKHLEAVYPKEVKSGRELLSC